jgi:hypothetical protein
MQRRGSTILLQGAHTWAAMIAMAMIAASLAAPLAAQNAASSAGERDSSGVGHLEVAVTYDATLSNMVGGSSFWMQGGHVETEGSFYRGLGVVADVGGTHAANINSAGAGLDLVTATFGPRYTWSHHRSGLFGQVLVGEAWGMNSTFPNPAGATTSANSLALEAGGGVNLALSPHFALRAFQANWFRTQLPNGASNLQNNLRLGAGFVFRFR